MAQPDEQPTDDLTEAQCTPPSDEDDPRKAALEDSPPEVYPDGD